MPHAPPPLPFQHIQSWGKDWGIAGYILLGRGPSYGPGGQCGVLIDNAYVTV